MPKGVYVRTKEQMQQIRKLGKRPKTQKQLEISRGSYLKGKPNPHKATVSGDDIIEHHNDLCHGAERPDDVTYMSHSEHSRLHANLQMKDGTHNFLINS